MKKTIGIFCGKLYVTDDLTHKWDENALNEGIGGSETWAISISSELSKMGYRVIMFADCPFHVSSDGVEYHPYETFLQVCGKTKFDYFIVSRFASIISTAINTDKLFLIAHDNFILEAYNLPELKLHLLDKIISLSDFQERQLMSSYPGLTQDYFVRSAVGIDWSLYSDVDTYHKKNKMVWSSHKSRGAKYLITKIFPIIKKEIPDFEIDVCSYANDSNDDYFNVDGINIKGKLSKKDLAELQKESKIWVYPNHGHFEDGTKVGETFCITAVENAAAKNAIVCAEKHAFTNTLDGYDGFVGTECFDGDNWLMDESRLDEFAVKLAEQAIKILKDENERVRLAEQAYNICKKFTWNNIAKALLYSMDPNEGKKIFVDLNQIKRNLVYHLWIPENMSENYRHILSIHLNCLKQFMPVFTDIKFVLSYDKKDDEVIKRLQRELFGDGFVGNISFVLSENCPFQREGKTYYDEILSKMDNLDGVTFFAHSKGVTNLDKANVIRENVEKWITFMYWMNLHYTELNVLALSKPHIVSSGTFKFEIRYGFTKNNWTYLGGFHWINTKKLYDYVCGVKPKSIDMGLSELYLGDNLPLNNDFSYSLNGLRFTYDDDPDCLYTKDIDGVISILLPNENEREKYYNFHNEMLKNT